MDQFPPSLQGFNGVLRGGPMASQALVLDNENRELVKAPARANKKGMSEAKVLAALKCHSEAERRRRERINAHLATLRRLLPCTEKMDKATLLAEVINQVKELKKTATGSCEGLLVPMDDDEVKVESYDSKAEDGNLCFKALLCCDYRPDLLSDIRQAIEVLELEMLSTEVSTLGGRMKIKFVFTTHGNKNTADDTQAPKLLANSITQALCCILEKGFASPEYSQRTAIPNKRRRVTLFDSCCSSY